MPLQKLPNIVLTRTCSVFGRITPGIIGDKFGRYNIMIIICIITAIIIFAVWIPVSSVAGIIVFAVIFGFSSGGFIGLAPTLVAQISELRQLGTRIGAVFSVQAIGALIGSPIGGAIVSSQNGSYLGLKIFCGCCMLLGCLSFLAARYVIGGASLKKKV